MFFYNYLQHLVVHDFDGFFLLQLHPVSCQIMLWNGSLTPSTSLFVLRNWGPESVAVDDRVIFQDFFQIVKPPCGHLEAVDSNVEADDADSEQDVEKVAVLVISQMP